MHCRKYSQKNFSKDHPCTKWYKKAKNLQETRSSWRIRIYNIAESYSKKTSLSVLLSNDAVETQSGQHSTEELSNSPLSKNHVPQNIQ